MTDRTTAAEAVTGGDLAFRLTDETPLYEGTDASGKVITKLSAGSIVTVHERAGDFLQVITPDDSFGFIPATTPVGLIDAMSLAPPEPSPSDEPLGPSAAATAAVVREQAARSARMAADRE